MSATKARVGRGTTVGYDLSSPFGTYVPCAEMVRIAAPEFDAGQVEVTHLESDDNAREFIPSGFIDYGAIELIGNYYTDEIETLQSIMEDQALVGWQITIPDKKNPSGTNTLITFVGYIKNFNPFGEAVTDGNVPLRHSLTVKISGKVTFTKATAGA